MSEVTTIQTDAKPRRKCRHFVFWRTRGENPCGLGHPIMKIAAARAGTEYGILKRLPCTTSPNPLADCPSYNPKTDAEIEADREALSREMDRVLLVFKAAGGWRKKMVAYGLRRAKVTCPACGEKDAMRVSCALGYNNHMRCHCEKCGAGFIE